MVRTLLAHSGALVRGALAYVLGAETDIEVVAELEKFDEVVSTLTTHRPHVSVVDVEVVPPGQLVELSQLHSKLGGGSALVLAEARMSGALSSVISGGYAGLGFVTKDGPPQRLIAAVRRAARGEQVVDPELVVHAVRSRSPLTRREAEVLSVAAEGAPVVEIAHRLRLSPGTVRNYLTRITSKVTARTRIEAVRIAQDAGWI